MPEPDWRRSSFCASGACVEAAADGPHILLRDSKNPQVAPLRFDRAAWQAFLDAVTRGEIR